ncbi:hypothetical protein ABW21_db0201731 [Orbilia brochopaga]|nr:hypothetical protein ABW21_db0201731 [Drechslerella brochopaga]
MLLKYLAIGITIGQAAVVLATNDPLNTKHCHANNCLRAVRATRGANTRLPEASRDCSSFYTAETPTIPRYATACSGDIAFKSACACIDVLPPTITEPPPVVLPSPTALFGDIVNGSPADYDDPFKQLTLPFPIVIYGVSTTNIYVSVNGFFSLNSSPNPIQDYPSYNNGQLPVNLDINNNYAEYLPPLTVAGFWDDLYIYAGTQQGIYWQVDGSPGSRTLQFEFYTSHYQLPNEYYHFVMKYKENIENIVEVTYYQVSDTGSSATIGAQNGQEFTQWSFNTAGAVLPGQTLRIDTTPNNSMVTLVI